MELQSLIPYAFEKVLETLSHNWYLLLLSIIISAVLKVYVNQDSISLYLRRSTRNSILTTTGIAVATPLCSCGTTALVLGMLASTVPWAPIVAFLVASPLTSPQELFYSAGLFGWKFAGTFFVSSIILGLAGGAAASFAESRGWLKNQARMSGKSMPAIQGGSVSLNLPVIQKDEATIGEGNWKISKLLKEIGTISMRLVPIFIGFTFIGYFLNGLIPSEWIMNLFGSGHIYGIPLAATLGLPFYLNTEVSLPIVRAMLDSGMSHGSALAFLITGAGTSIGAFGGMLTIARWRVIALVVGTLWIGSILIGILYNLLPI